MTQVNAKVNCFHKVIDTRAQRIKNTLTGYVCEGLLMVLLTDDDYGVGDEMVTEKYFNENLIS